MEKNAISPPASFPGLLKSLILQVLLRQTHSQGGNDVFKDHSKVGSSTEQSAPVCVALCLTSSSQRLSRETCFSQGASTTPYTEHSSLRS